MMLNQFTHNHSLAIQDNPVVFFALLPLFHVAGLQPTCLRGMLGGPVRYIFLSKWDLEKVVELIPKYVSSPNRSAGRAEH